MSERWYSEEPILHPQPQGSPVQPGCEDPQGVSGGSCAPNMALGMRWIIIGWGAELELPCSFCPFLDLKILLLNCHRKPGVYKLRVASAVWGTSTNIQCLNIYSIWPEVLVKIIERFIKYWLQVSHPFIIWKLPCLDRSFSKSYFAHCAKSKANWLTSRLKAHRERKRQWSKECNWLQNCHLQYF